MQTDWDVAANMVRVQDGGRQKLWQQVKELSSAVALPLTWQTTLEAASGHRIPVEGSFSSAFRFWRHRVPRPDAVWLAWTWKPIEGDGLTVASIDLPEADHKRSFTCLCEGIVEAAASTALYPLGGIAIEVHHYHDDGRSSPEGLRLAAAAATEQMILTGYRQGLIPYV